MIRRPRTSLNAYNKAATDLRVGLAELQASPGSYFTFKILETEDGLRATTNIPDNSKMSILGSEDISISVTKDGRISVDGAKYMQELSWGLSAGYCTQQFSAKGKGAARKALQHVRKKAWKKGLIR